MPRPRFTDAAYAHDFDPRSESITAPAAHPSLQAAGCSLQVGRCRTVPRQRGGPPDGAGDGQQGALLMRQCTGETGSPDTASHGDSDRRAATLAWPPQRPGSAESTGKGPDGVGGRDRGRQGCCFFALLRWRSVAFGARGAGHEYLLLSRSLHEQTVYRASGVKLLPLRPRNWPQRQAPAEHSMRTSVGHGGPARDQARRPLSDSDWGPDGRPGTEGPSRDGCRGRRGSLSMRLRAACPPCRAAPSRRRRLPPRARMRRADKGERWCRAASRCRASSREGSGPPAPRPGRRAAPPRR